MSKLMLNELTHITRSYSLPTSEAKTPKSALEWIQMGAGLGPIGPVIVHHVSHSKDVTTANHCFTEYPQWPLLQPATVKWTWPNGNGLQFHVQCQF